MKSTNISKLTKAFDIKPYSAVQLADMYGVSEYIMRKWLRAIRNELGRKTGWYYSIQQVEIIISIYGTPGKTVNENP